MPGARGAPSSPTRPRARARSPSSIASRGRPPGRSSRGASVKAGDDRRFQRRPASGRRRAPRRCGPRDRRGRGRRSVGLTRPERLAEGAATGRPTRRRSVVRDRMRRHAQRHAVEPGAGEVAHRQPGAAGTTSVSGPGQKRRASAQRGCRRRRPSRRAAAATRRHARSAG